MEENKEDSIKTEKELQGKYEANILNPLTLVNAEGNDEAMKKCFNLLAACDGIILCKHWNMSTGCKQEVEFAISRLKDVMILEDL